MVNRHLLPTSEYLLQLQIVSKDLHLLQLVTEAALLHYMVDIMFLLHSAIKVFLPRTSLENLHRKQAMELHLRDSLESLLQRHQATHLLHAYQKITR
jgi:hypothetical protein